MHLEILRLPLIEKENQMKKGIDVSEWQKDIDWDKLAASGEVDFVMIRAGFSRNDRGRGVLPHALH